MNFTPDIFVIQQFQLLFRNYIKDIANNCNVIFVGSQFGILAHIGILSIVSKENILQTIIRTQDVGYTSIVLLTYIMSVSFYNNSFLCYSRCLDRWFSISTSDIRSTLRCLTTPSRNILHNTERKACFTLTPPYIDYCLLIQFIIYSSCSCCSQIKENDTLMQNYIILFNLITTTLL